MKRFRISALLVLSGCCLFIFSCNRRMKDVMYDRNKVPPEQLESARVWYMEHLNTQTAQKVIAGPGFAPYWKRSWIITPTDGSMLLVVPAPQRPMQHKNKNMSDRRLFIFTISGQTVTNGRILEMISRKYDIKDHLNILLKNYNQDYIAGYNGSILQYDVNYKPVTNAVYDNGRRAFNKRTEIVIMTGAALKKRMEQAQNIEHKQK